ncbi:MAG: leucyl aminopeptidase [Pseudomonadota bacterium]
MKTAFAPLDVLPTKGTLVLLAAADGDLGGTAGDLDHKTGGTIKHAIELAGDKFKRGAIDLMCPSGVELDRILVFALDDSSESADFDLELIGGRMAVKLNALGIEAAHVAVDAFGGLDLNAADVALALAAGVRLRNYRFDKYRTTSDEESETAPKGIEAVTFHLADADAASERWASVAAIAAGVEHGRDLVTEPANVLNPAAFAEECRKLEGEVGLEVEVLDRAALEKLGMGALLGVAQGSVQEPFVVTMNWRGGADGEAPVALVGKGVCFDTGGISLKPSGGMEEMKWDMGGAAAVFGAMKAIAGRKAEANVVGVLGLVENMPSGTAQRPGDVVTAMSGTTIEVINTDAEGRLVLADALHYTKERFEPKLMIDVATLTGAVIIALGNEQAGLFASEDSLAEQLTSAGEAVGERVWRLPMDGNYPKHIKSEIADIKNTGRPREAGATAGAVFLQHFVGDTPWAHLDIAGVAWSKRDLPLAGKGATGFGVRLLDRFVADNCEAVV